MSGTFYQRALAAFRLKRWDLARKELAEELIQNPQNAQALGLLAACSLNLGELPAAIEQARTGVKANPQLAYAHYILALSYLRAKQKFEAELAIEDALNIEPRNPDYIAVLASIKIQERSWDKGMKLLDHALAEDPSHHYSLRQKYYLRLAQKHKKSAEEIRHKILEFYPEDAEMHANSGWQKLENPRERERALEHFQEALRLDPQADNYVEGLIEARFHEQTTVTGWANILNTLRFKICAVSLACVLIYLCSLAWKETHFSLPLFLTMVLSAIMLVTLAIFARTISKAIYYSSIYLSKEKRAALPKTSRKKAINTALGVVGGLACMGIGIFCGIVGVSENSIPHFLAADWIVIVGRRYVLFMPVLFGFAVLGFLSSLRVMTKSLIKKEPRTTKYFQVLYIGIASTIILVLFVYVAAFRPGGWFIWFLLPLELALIFIPQTNIVRQWVKGEIRKDQERMTT